MMPVRRQNTPAHQVHSNYCRIRLKTCVRKRRILPLLVHCRSHTPQQHGPLDRAPGAAVARQESREERLNYPANYLQLWPAVSDSKCMCWDLTTLCSRFSTAELPEDSHNQGWHFTTFLWSGISSKRSINTRSSAILCYRLVWLLWYKTFFFLSSQHKHREAASISLFISSNHRKVFFFDSVREECECECECELTVAACSPAGYTSGGWVWASCWRHSSLDGASLCLPSSCIRIWCTGTLEGKQCSVEFCWWANYAWPNIQWFRYSPCGENRRCLEWPGRRRSGTTEGVWRFVGISHIHVFVFMCALHKTIVWSPTGEVVRTPLLTQLCKK